MKPIRVHYHNLAKHGITEQEVRECVQTGKRQYKRRAGKGVYRIIGQTSAGCYLELLVADHPDERFVFHAIDARMRDVRLLKRRGKGR